MPPSVMEKAVSERKTQTLLLSHLVAKATNATTIVQIEYVISKCETLSNEIMDNHRKIVASAPSDLPDHEAELLKLLDIVDQTVCDLKTKHVALAPTPTSTSTTTATGSAGVNVSLPRLELPHFGGKLDEWISFRDLFVVSVHNNGSLSNAQKLTYLKSCLTGEAAHLLHSIPPTDSNYKIAWKMLEERFYHERENVFSILRRFVNQPNIHQDSAEALRSLIDVSKECLRILKLLGITVDSWNAIVIFLLSSKLDSASRQCWELSLKDTKIPSTDEFIQFLDQRARALASSSSCIYENPKLPTLKRSQSLSQNDVPKKKTFFNHHLKTEQCKFCSLDHLHYKCSKFLEMNQTDREQAVKQHSLCFNCLRGSHSASNCPSDKRCKSCQGRHHSLLHSDRFNKQSTESKLVVSHHSRNNDEPGQSLLATAVLQVLDTHGNSHLCRALLDGGSTTSFVTESLAKRLRLQRNRIYADVSGLSATTVGTVRGSVSLTIKPRFNVSTSSSHVINALILHRITTQLPLHLCDPTVWPHLNNLQLADPNFYKPSEVDLLLGSDIFWNILEPTILKGSPNTPVAVQSSFGWLVAGNLNSKPSQVVVHFGNVDLDRTLQRFWQLESVPTASTFTEDEQACEAHFAATHTRTASGRFSVKLPIKPAFKVTANSSSHLGVSRANAIRRLKQLERRFISYPERRQQYIDFMREYVKLGHMALVPDRQVHRQLHPIVYIPHHFVTKDSSTTTKLRVVFDASCKTSTGNSLNDVLMSGPTIQDNLNNIIMRFRTHIVAFTADIAKMYRQVLVSSPDTDLQRIVWREDPSGPIRDYRLLTVTYGTTSAPYQATKALQQLAHDEKKKFPLGSAVLLQDFYVDDVLSGAANEKLALEVQRQLLDLLTSGGFDLRKWSSNRQTLLESIPDELRETKVPLELNKEDSIKTLGINWCPGLDQFFFKVNLPSIPKSFTKRTLLSEVASLFDPIGWLAPAVIKAKILIQELWNLKLSWDDPLPGTIQEEWKIYRSNLSCIEQIKLNRCLVTEDTTSISLIGFCDASERAYAAVVYCQAHQHSGQSLISLVTSKTRVAPIKQVSLPRPELCGAVLLAELLESTKEALKIPIQSVIAYTDSTVVLSWLRSQPTRWKTFVANRVSQIQQVLPSECWKHVPGSENPADCASRGLDPSELVEHQLWWQGPAWLSRNHVPENPQQISENETTLKEEKKLTVQVHMSTTDDESLIHKYSSLRKLKRIVAWCSRFSFNCRNKSATKVQELQPLSADELQSAFLRLIRIVQSNGFQSDVKCLRDKQSLNSKSRILSLAPFLDASGFLRVGGRLKNSPLTFNRKHPLLLPRHHKLTQLIIMDEHEKFHAGAQQLLVNLQNNFWIVNGRDAVRQQIKKCVTCTRHAAALQQQIMGNLPPARVTPCRPFLKTGVDYAGPFFVKPMSPRSKTTIKVYIALFVCFTTRAIHIEVVSSLSTATFLAALKRFIARRGKCSDLFSDCGTNFVGASREMQEMLDLLKSTSHNNQIHQQLANEGIRWHFNPAGAPHFGGLWEAGIKSVKFHLSRIVGSARLNFEELSTVTAQIESCLNSRPLTPTSADPNDFSVLTPGHFLVGSSLESIPEPDHTSEKINRLTHWQLTQQLFQHFWNRWSQEFLTRLQQRPKWLKQRNNIMINDLVLIRDERLPPLKWKLGRVIATHPGEDNQVRVVTLRTADGELKRPIAKLCLLPIDNNEFTNADVHDNNAADIV